MWTIEQIDSEIREYELIIRTKRKGYNLKNCEQILKHYKILKNIKK